MKRQVGVTSCNPSLWLDLQSKLAGKQTTLTNTNVVLVADCPSHLLPCLATSSFPRLTTNIQLSTSLFGYPDQRFPSFALQEFPLLSSAEPLVSAWFKFNHQCLIKDLFVLEIGVWVCSAPNSAMVSSLRLVLSVCSGFDWENLPQRIRWKQLQMIPYFNLRLPCASQMWTYPPTCLSVCLSLKKKIKTT